MSDMGGEILSNEDERERGSLLFRRSREHFVNAAFHVEVTFGDMIKLAIENHLEAADSLFDGNVFTRRTGKYFRDCERL
jgi:hypothetical protein